MAVCHKAHRRPGRASLQWFVQHLQLHIYEQILAQADQLQLL